jgi:4-amino-4-deoxy-L-arabinose transferase-like glycosyltransferase
MNNNTINPTILPRRDRAFLIGLALYVLVLHAALLAYDAANGFSPFFRVDRGAERVEAMDAVFEARDWHGIGAAIASNQIIAGEYLVQTALFKIGGPLAVIVVQILLQVCSVFAVYRIASLTLNSPALSIASAVLYATLPHSLAFAHQFASEALAVPLVVVGFWLFVEYLVADAPLAFLLAAGCLFGVTACIRPVMLLLPLFSSLFVIATQRRHVLRDAIGLVVAGALAPLVLVAFIFSATHHISLGNTNSGMGYNLYLRVTRITHTLPASDREAVVATYFGGRMNDKCSETPIQPDGSSCTLSLSDYAAFVIHYPLASARHTFEDMVTFVAKSGVSSLTANYLDLSSKAEDIKDYKHGWRAVWESQGLFAAIRKVLEASPLIAIIELAGSALFLIFSCCFFAGCSQVLRRSYDHLAARPRRIALSALAFYPFYIFATSQVGAYMVSRYRYPGEFAMCIIAVLGAGTLRRFLHARSDSASSHDS